MMIVLTSGIQALEFVQTGAILRISVRDAVGMVLGKREEELYVVLSSRAATILRFTHQGVIGMLPDASEENCAWHFFSRIAMILRFAARDVWNGSRESSSSFNFRQEHRQNARKKVCTVFCSRVVTILGIILRDGIGMILGRTRRHSNPGRERRSNTSANEIVHGLFFSHRDTSPLFDDAEEPLDRIRSA
jgi:hypothetical protein